MTVIAGGVRAPDRAATMPCGPQSSEWCQLFASSRTSSSAAAFAPDTGTAISRPKPSSFRQIAIDEPSGDHANERWPGDHVGAA